ncbi:MAG: sensor histidine kinase [Myxococcota bacterium]
MPRRRLSSVRDWPLSLKLATTVLVLAVIPLLVVALVNARAVESQSFSRETHNLQRRSAAAARRLEERVGRLRAYVELVATNPTILAAMADGATGGDDHVADARAWDERHPEIYDLLVSLRQSNPWFSNVYLLDPTGVCIATSERATKPQMVGRPYDYRPYFQAAIEDRGPFVTDVLKNANSEGTAIFVAAPVMVKEAVEGVVVLKVDSAALHEVMADLARTGGSALLVDRFGVVVSDAWTGTLRGSDDPQSLQFHPLASVARFDTLFLQTRRYGTPDGEHYLDRVRQPLALGQLWSALQHRQPGATEHDVPQAYGTDTAPTMVGYAPVMPQSGDPYGYVLLGEPTAEFRQPLHRIAEAALLRFGLVAFGVALLIALLIRRFSRQIVDLAQGARRLAAGQPTPPLALDRRDEIGVLADSIQRLADHVREAVDGERQARKDSEQARDAAETRAQTRAAAVVQAHAALAGARRLLDNPPGGVEPREGLRHAGRQLHGATIDLAALSGGGTPLRPEPVRLSVATLAQQVVDALPDDTPDRSVTVAAEGDIPEIETDAALLRRILEHLLDNACKFTRRGTVQLKVEAEDAGVRVSVVDTGIGLTARQVERIMADPDEPLAGGGIGLSVTRLLVRILGARIHAHGEVGQGSTVAVVLPPQLPPDPATSADG